MKKAQQLNVQELLEFCRTHVTLYASDGKGKKMFVDLMGTKIVTKDGKTYNYTDSQEAVDKYNDL